jgi:hypothetical protein
VHGRTPDLSLIQISNSLSACTTVIASVSEATHAAAQMDCFVAFRLRSLSYGGQVAPLRKRYAFVAGNDGKTQLRDLAAGFARGLACSFRPFV